VVTMRPRVQWRLVEDAGHLKSRMTKPCRQAGRLEGKSKGTLLSGTWSRVSMCVFQRGIRSKERLSRRMGLPAEISMFSKKKLKAVLGL
jgi:hypothetical protein